MRKPNVWVSLQVESGSFNLTSLSANTGHLAKAGIYQEDITKKVPPELMAPEIIVRARLKSVAGKTRAQLLVWSSESEDEEPTPLNGGWTVLEPTKESSTDFVVLRGVFDNKEHP